MRITDYVVIQLGIKHLLTGKMRILENYKETLM
jgi:hypothetical protein